MKEKFKTIKVLESSIVALNSIAALTKEMQYQVVDRIAIAEQNIVFSSFNKKKKK